jgi:hypothetical protein
MELLVEQMKVAPMKPMKTVTFIIRITFVASQMP